MLLWSTSYLQRWLGSKECPVVHILDSGRYINENQPKFNLPRPLQLDPKPVLAYRRSCFYPGLGGASFLQPVSADTPESHPMCP